MKSFMLIMILAVVSFACNNSGTATVNTHDSTAPTTVTPDIELTSIKPTKDAIQGTWANHLDLDEEDSKKLSGSKEQGDFIITTIADGNSTYASSGDYSDEGTVKFSLRVKKEDDPVTISFRYSDTGKWDLVQDTLIEITTEHQYIPADEITKEFLKKLPSFAKGLENIGEKRYAFTIQRLTKETMESKNQETGFVETAHKRN